MIIIEDKAQQCGKHELKHIYFEENSIYWVRQPLPVGDYIVASEKVNEVIERKQKRGIDVKKMDLLGSYSVSVDTKKDMQEVIGNICGPQHSRFRDECILAQNNNIELYVLVENTEGIQSIDDLFHWHNPRLDIYVPDKSNILGYYKNGNPRYARKQKYPKATRGEQLAKAMLSMQLKYGVKFVFCAPCEAGARIVQLLGEH